MAARARILIVDDEVNARNALAELLREDGYVVETAADGFKALHKLEELKPDVVLTDLKMPGMSGLELLEKARDRDPNLVVLVMTAYGAVESAIAAMRKGAADYLGKPVDIERLGLVLARELERRQLRIEAEGLRARLKEERRLQQLVGSSPAMRKVIETVLQVASTQASVLITGESGTGKELVASAIHEHGERAGAPFVKVHCAALTEPLLEEELFGYASGAHQGPRQRREGRIEQAHHGTLFLDEIADIPPAIQVRLLRFLQEQSLERVGGQEAVRADVRVIAATHKDLGALVQAGSFRDDLYYRLAVVQIDLPPLRDRAGDVPILAMQFLGRFAERNRRAVTGFEDDALELITRYGWPGNVRELENVIERAVVVCPAARIRKQDLPPQLVGEHGRGAGAPMIPGATLAELERYAILRTLESTGGSTIRAAEVLGISPRKIQYKLHDYSTPSPTKRRP